MPKLTAKEITKAIKRGDLTVGEAMNAVAAAQEDRRRVNRILKLARDTLRLSDGELELDDDNAIISEGDDNGTYISCWAWVDFSGTKLDKEPEETRHAVKEATK